MRVITQVLGILIVGLLLVSCYRVEGPSKIYREHPRDNVFISYTQNGKYGYMDRTGKIVIKAQFDHAYEFTEELAAVEMNRKWGFIDRTGKLIIAPQFVWVDSFSEGLSLVIIGGKLIDAGKGYSIEGGKYGYIDKTGKVVIDARYDFAQSFSEGLALVKLNGNQNNPPDETNEHWMVMTDAHGKQVRVPTFSESTIYGVSVNKAKNTDTGNKYGFINKTGKYVIPPRFEDASNFSEGLAPVMEHQSWGFIDKTGKTVIPFQYEEVRAFSKGFAPVRDNSAWGFIDLAGKMVIPAQYEDAGWFSEGLARVQKGGQWGYVDLMGKMVIQPHYDYAEDFNNGQARVILKGKLGTSDKWMIIDKSGKTLKSL